MLSADNICSQMHARYGSFTLKVHRRNAIVHVQACSVKEEAGARARSNLDRSVVDSDFGIGSFAVCMSAALEVQGAALNAKYGAGAVVATSPEGRHS